MFNDFLLGVCYFPEHWDAKRHESDIARIARAGFKYVRMGEGAWSYFEPEEGKYQFDLFDRVIGFCRKHNVKVIMGTPTYCGPAWVANEYPEVLRWNFERIPMKHGSRRFYNYTSPKYLELSDRICTALAKHYAKKKQIIAWQLDNEFNCHMSVSYAPSDTIAFREWLKAKYKTLPKLNDAWGTKFWSQTYSDWNQIDLPHPTATKLNPSQLLDESRFISDMVVRFAKRQEKILRKVNPKWLITHNGMFDNVNGPDLVSALDFYSHDNYPLFGNDWTGATWAMALSRSLSFPFAIMEQQAGPGGQMDYFHRTPQPGEIRLWSWQAIAHGAKVLSYFRWRTCPYGSEQHWHGLIDQDDRDNRRLGEAMQIAEETASLPREFFDAPVIKSIAVLSDYDNEVNDKRINRYTRDKGHWEIGQWVSAIAKRHVMADLVRPESSLAGYRVVIVPHLKIIDIDLVKKLEKFARAGGTIVIGAQSGAKDRNCHIVEMPLPGLLRTLAGVEVEDWTTLRESEVRQARLAIGKTISMHTFAERLRPLTAETVGFWETDDTLLNNGVAMTHNPVGKGSVYYVGGYFSPEASDAIVGMLIDQSIVKPLVDAPASVEAVSRKGFLALLNHSSQAERISGLRGKALLGEIEDGAITLPPFGVAILRA